MAAAGTNTENNIHCARPTYLLPCRLQMLQRICFRICMRIRPHHASFPAEIAPYTCHRCKM